MKVLKNRILGCFHQGRNMVYVTNEKFFVKLKRANFFLQNKIRKVRIIDMIFTEIYLDFSSIPIINSSNNLGIGICTFSRFHFRCLLSNSFRRTKLMNWEVLGKCVFSILQIFWISSFVEVSILTVDHFCACFCCFMGNILHP